MNTKKTHKIYYVRTDWNAINNNLVNGFENFFTLQLEIQYFLRFNFKKYY